MAIDLEKAYPDTNIANQVKDFPRRVPDLGIELYDIKTSTRDSFGFEFWWYLFQRPGSEVVLKISIAWPAPSIYISFSRDKDRFSFADYLVYLGSDELKKLDAKVIDQRPNYTNKHNISDTLNLLEKYLKEGALAKVAAGELWIDVPFDWTGIK